MARALADVRPAGLGGAESRAALVAQRDAGGRHRDDPGRAHALRLGGAQDLEAPADEGPAGALARLALPGIQPLWILDEPFNALDAASTQALARRIDAHAAAGGSIVLTTHFDLPLLSQAVRTLDLGLA